MCDRNDSVILDAQRDGVTDSVAIAKKTGLQVNLLKPSEATVSRQL